MSEVGEPALPVARLPWEEHNGASVWRRYVDTLLPSLLQPQRFFAVLAQPEGPTGFADLLRYDLLTHLVGSSGPAVFYGLTLIASPPDMLASLSIPMRLGLILGLFLASGPAGLLFDLGYALIIHGTLRFIGETPGGLRGTVRAVMYGGGSTALNCTLLLPAFFIPQLWGTYCTIIALMHGQRVSRGRALTAVIVPSGVILMLAAIVLALGLPMAMGKLGELGLLPPSVQI